MCYHYPNHSWCICLYCFLLRITNLLIARLFCWNIGLYLSRPDWVHCEMYSHFRILKWKLNQFIELWLPLKWLKHTIKWPEWNICDFCWCANKVINICKHSFCLRTNIRASFESASLFCSCWFTISNSTQQQQLSNWIHMINIRLILKGNSINGSNIEFQSTNRQLGWLFLGNVLTDKIPIKKNE